MKKVLYVEDHKDTAEAVKSILAREGIETETVPSGKAALKRAEKGYGLFLLDIMLPDMSGWDLFQSLKKKVNGAKYLFLSVIPISTERARELKRVGISEYITKPFRKKDLVAKVKKALR
ncbi:response regulator [Candidatus Woesearchaeota archaeon]|nr:response regulator [Candidatus Woesearchaeota archaeon]